MRRLPLLALISALVMLAAAQTAPAGSSSDGPIANAARKCPMSIETARSLGTTYVKSLRVSGTKCRHGRKLVKAFNACRKEHGGRDGKCPDRVYDYKCTEDRYNKSEFSFDSLTKCKKTGRRVNFRYQQNL